MTRTAYGNQPPPHAPAPQRNNGPDGLDESEWPGALQKSVSRSQRANAGEGEDEPEILKPSASIELPHAFRYVKFAASIL